MLAFIRTLFKRAPAVTPEPAVRVVEATGDPYIPNQMCSLMQSLEYALVLLREGSDANDPKVRQFCENAERNLVFAQEMFDKEWTRVIDHLPDSRLSEPEQTQVSVRAEIHPLPPK